MVGVGLNMCVCPVFIYCLNTKKHKMKKVHVYIKRPQTTKYT